MQQEQEVKRRQHQAVQLLGEGYNCAQAVACALADLVDADTAVLFGTLEGFGFGMGTSTETCGAVSGGIALVGIRNSAGIDIRQSKQSTYEVAKQLVEGFRTLNGSTLCGDLKGFTTSDHKPLRSCEGCVEDAVKLTCALLDELDKKSGCR